MLVAFAETGLERILEDAFAGQSIEFLLEKIVHIQWASKQLEEVLTYNHLEVRTLYFQSNADGGGRQNLDLS